MKKNNVKIKKKVRLVKPLPPLLPKAEVPRVVPIKLAPRKKKISVPPVFNLDNIYRCPRCKNEIQRNYQLNLENEDYDETFYCKVCEKDWYVMWVSNIYSDKSFNERV